MRSFKNIAKLIREKRLGHPKGYSQLELSHHLGYKNGQFISNVERALCNIPLKMLSKISELLNISRQELIEAILSDQEVTLNNYLNEGIRESNVSNFNAGISNHLPVNEENSKDEEINSIAL